jgi:seryl-tRNA synthetase
MIDLMQLREFPDAIIAALAKKDPSYDGKRLYHLDCQVRELRQEVENLRARKNDLAKQGRSGITDTLREQSLSLGKELGEKEDTLLKLEREMRDLYLAAPNIPLNDVPVGGKEANKVVKMVGEKPVFSYSIKNHVELGVALGWFDFESAARMTGTNFPLYKNEAVFLIYRLALLMLKNNMDHGYDPVIPPLLVNAQALEVTGNFPKFKDQVYTIGDDGLYLTPTSEVNLANIYADHIFMAQELPVRLTSWTNCFRREAGGYGALERGLIRIHQFEKVELYSFCEPHDSPHELDRMVACAEEILKKLGLHYRITLLAGQDCSFASTKTYDIEVWSPGQNSYLEVASCSNCTDFQSRRGKIRYRKTVDGKPQLVHTLNASSLALPRIMVALMETYQQGDGMIMLPEILRNPIVF